MFRPVL